MSKAKAIMVQGTMSNAGKSLLTAGLCRVFSQDGYRVSPFKSQNMALNSFITSEGLEMGRAQVVQAEACGREPSVRMNPILLKPVSDMGSQVIVNGEVLGNMSAAQYYAFKKRLIPHILNAYHALAAESDIIVIEGAGSPAEINLKENDIVNMGMAKMAEAPVLLVGDIDRGGVFAQLVGTISLLEAEEQAIIKATVINKFRGDRGILEPGLRLLREKTGKPVAGVLPWIQADIEDEDSLAGRLVNGRRPVRAAMDRNGAAAPPDPIDIAVIRLPHLANFTDFMALEATKGFSLRYVSRLADLGSPDMVILPGAKNTIQDLQWLRQTGLEAAIKKLTAGGAVLFGVCGGYQMLGEKITDSQGVEGGGAIDGMGLLPVMTEFAPKKHRSRVTGRLARVEGPLAALSGAQVTGYEIHMGRSFYLDHQAGNGVAASAGSPAGSGSSQARPLLILENGQPDGCQLHNIYGTYLHGFFDSEACRQGLLASLCRHKGIPLPDAPSLNYAQYKEQQYNLLADSVRQNMDMALIYHILEAGL
jgi:adenosylcobyric acid synthase